MQLIIAEKPKQAEKLAAPYPSVKRDGYIEIKPCDRFPQGAKLAYAVGHLCELQELKRIMTPNGNDGTTIICRSSRNDLITD
ncbi:hypothetical protein OVA29_15100 [Exiguobacterium sp. SL14]|nr:hypothetical protein [Exiguobacterium sp. SL14]MCY1691831.1 hypothetical protein [Exiguobacterium sp. SL14]